MESPERTLAVAFAKLAGIRRAAESALDEDVGRGRGPRARQYFPPDLVANYFEGTAEYLGILARELPQLYGDFSLGSAVPEVKMGAPGQQPPLPNHYSPARLNRLIRDIDQIFEIRANSELQPPASVIERPRRVFISHGRSKDWLEVQAYIEKDVGIPTLELAQEPNLGMTVIEKLEANAPQCDSAVIVMTGDDIDAEGRAHARENVMHEIGFFQGRYGRKPVCVLHEEGVSIPTNLGGVVYIAFPKGYVSAAFHVLARELSALYGRR